MSLTSEIQSNLAIKNSSDSAKFGRYNRVVSDPLWLKFLFVIAEFQSSLRLLTSDKVQTSLSRAYKTRGVKMAVKIPAKTTEERTRSSCSCNASSTVPMIVRWLRSKSSFWNQKLNLKSGVSNSTMFAGHFLMRKELAGSTMRQKCLHGPQKCSNTTLNCSFNNKNMNFDDNAGRISKSGGPRVWDPCLKRSLQFVKVMENSY